MAELPEQAEVVPDDLVPIQEFDCCAALVCIPLSTFTCIALVFLVVNLYAVFAGLLVGPLAMYWSSNEFLQRMTSDYMTHSLSVPTDYTRVCERSFLITSLYEVPFSAVQELSQYEITFVSGLLIKIEVLLFLAADALGIGIASHEQICDFLGRQMSWYWNHCDSIDSTFDRIGKALGFKHTRRYVTNRILKQSPAEPFAKAANSSANLEKTILPTAGFFIRHKQAANSEFPHLAFYIADNFKEPVKTTPSDPIYWPDGEPINTTTPFYSFYDLYGPWKWNFTKFISTLLFGNSSNSTDL